MTHATCKDCTERKIGCHSVCEKYIKFKTERDAELEAEHKSRSIYGELQAYQVQKYKRLKK